jgi:hypothetical protein
MLLKESTEEAVRINNTDDATSCADTLQSERLISEPKVGASQVTGLPTQSADSLHSL